MTEIRMPIAGKDISRGSVVQWLKSLGAKVHRDEPLAILLFDKVEFELASPAAGTLTDICVPPGQECPVGEILGWIEEGPTAMSPTTAGEQKCERTGR